MSYLSARFYDYLMRASEEACLRDWRAQLLSQVRGQVLEIGAGTGASLPLYPWEQMTQLSMTEPDDAMRQCLLQRIEEQALTRVKVLPCRAECIDCDDASFDFVFVSLVCCSVTDLRDSLREIIRVLKPGGGLLFLEHVAAEQGCRRRRWQDRLNFIWRRLAGNCHLNRETEAAIEAAGLTIEAITRESMRKAIPLARPTIRGIARKPPTG